MSKKTQCKFPFMAQEPLTHSTFAGPRADKVSALIHSTRLKLNMQAILSLILVWTHFSTGNGSF